MRDSKNMDMDLSDNAINEHFQEIDVASEVDQSLDQDNQVTKKKKWFDPVMAGVIGVATIALAGAGYMIFFAGNKQDQPVHAFVPPPPVQEHTTTPPMAIQPQDSGVMAQTQPMPAIQEQQPVASPGEAAIAVSPSAPALQDLLSPQPAQQQVTVPQVVAPSVPVVSTPTAEVAQKEDTNIVLVDVPRNDVNPQIAASQAVKPATRRAEPVKRPAPAPRPAARTTTAQPKENGDRKLLLSGVAGSAGQPVFAQQITPGVAQQVAPGKVIQQPTEKAQDSKPSLNALEIYAVQGNKAWLRNIRTGEVSMVSKGDHTVMGKVVSIDPNGTLVRLDSGAIIR